MTNSCNTSNNSNCGCNAPSKVENTNTKQHWETVYSKTDHKKLGWYEENPKPSIDLINICNLNKNANILNIGAGATTLIDVLINQNYTNIIATDISQNALGILLDRIKSNQNVSTIVDDLTNPNKLNLLSKIDLWHDRAVLHFLIDEKDQTTYFNLLKSKVKINGFVILAMFNFNGATKCSGLPIKQYNSNLLAKKLGDNFELIKAFDYTYTMPSSDTREYVYTLFKKIK